MQIPQVLSEMLASAAKKCDHQAQSERVLGYIENAKTYQEIADLARSNSFWLRRQDQSPQRKYPVGQAHLPRATPRRAG